MQNLPRRPSLKSRLDDYASFHQTRTNQVAHWIGIPLAVMTSLGLLGHLVILDGWSSSEILRFDAGGLVWVFGMIWCFLMDWQLALPFGFVTLGLYFLGRSIAVPALVGLFVLAWAIQIAGHFFFEKKSPALFKKPEHFLVGPLWLFSKLIGHQLTG